jgi:hypothetical protein
MILNDAILPYHEKDRPTIEKCVESLQNVIGVNRLFLISKENPKIPNTIFISEDEFVDIVQLAYIQDIWNKSGSKYSYRASWIYQQIIKLAASDLIQDLSDDYIISDTDIIYLINPYNNIENEVFPYDVAYKREYHEPYRLNYNRLMKEPTTAGFSFINHHMVKNKKYIKEIKNHIEKVNKKSWDISIIESLDFNSFSDFASDDLYGNWMYKYHPDKTKKVNIRIKDINYIPDDNDFIYYKNSGFNVLSSQAWAR